MIARATRKEVKEVKAMLVTEQIETAMKSLDYSMRSICSRSGIFLLDSIFLFLS